MVYTTGRPASGTIGLPPAPAVTVSAISILSESDSESSAVGPAMPTVSSVGPGGNTVSAAASVRIKTGLETRPPPLATSRPVRPVWVTTVLPVALSTAIVVSGVNQKTAVAAESP